MQRRESSSSTTVSASRSGVSGLQLKFAVGARQRLSSSNTGLFGNPFSQEVYGMSMVGKYNLNPLRLVLAVMLLFSPLLSIVTAQNPELQQRLAEIKLSIAENKHALAQYTWQEQQTISIKGEVKKQEIYQVRMDAGGQMQKTPLTAQTEQASAPNRGRLKRHVVEKKKEEYKEYSEQIANLARLYAHPDAQRLQQAYQQGNLSLGPGAPGEIYLLIHNYVKPKDSVTITFNREQKTIQGMQISSYLDQPNDAVNINVQFSKLPNGTNHVSNVLVNGVSKQLTVQMQNSNYQRM
jgi:hypothetical protein